MSIPWLVIWYVLCNKSVSLSTVLSCRVCEVPLSWSIASLANTSLRSGICLILRYLVGPLDKVWGHNIFSHFSFIDETFLHSRSTVYLDSVRLTSKSKRSLNWTTPEEEVVVLGRLRLVEDREIRLNIRRLSLQTIGWYFNWKRTLYLPLLYCTLKQRQHTVQ